MFKKIFIYFKKFIFAFLLLYAYNKVALPTNLIIPINFVTVGMVTFFGIPSIIMLVLFSFISV